MSSFRAKYLARHSQTRECVAFERGARGSDRVRHVRKLTIRLHLRIFRSTNKI
ncbi:MAG: hypothetical protein ACFE96_09960 [Candidatus Hermodarchaeota archaeon]